MSLKPATGHEALLSYQSTPYFPDSHLRRIIASRNSIHSASTGENSIPLPLGCFEVYRNRGWKMHTIHTVLYYAMVVVSPCIQDIAKTKLQL